MIDLVYCINCLAKDNKHNEEVIIWDGFSLCIKHAEEYIKALDRARFKEKTALYEEMIKGRKK